MFIIDNNLSPKLIPALKTIYPRIVHVLELGMDEDNDLDIWNFAHDNELHIATKDKYFQNIQYSFGYPPKIIWIQCDNVSSKYIITILKSQKNDILSFIDHSSFGTYVIL